MAHIRSTISAALVAIISCLAVLLTSSPASAERVVLTDGAGEGTGSDITEVVVHHKAERIRFKVDLAAMPGTFVTMNLDVPDGKKWEWLVSFDNLSSRLVYVYPRDGGADDWTCRERPTIQYPEDGGAVYRFAFERSCFDSPESVRVKVRSEDRDSGDVTRWSDWAESA